MRFDKRQVIFGVFFVGVAGAILLLPTIYFIARMVAPPPPVPARIHAPQPFAAAVWARAGGGRATELIPINTFSMAEFAACMAVETFRDTTAGDARRVEACRGQMPALQGVEHLSNVHMRDSNLSPSFREGLGRFATTVWMTRSWSKAEFVDTLTERGRFGIGIRGAHAAARYYFGHELGDLSLPQAALLAAFVGERNFNPWGEPEFASEARNRVLTLMRDDLAIDAAAYDAATRAPLGLSPEQPPHLPGS